uniref:Charged multivesicular body protein 2A n=1 Tax=Spermophilus dauricus TaxID=99837 RepID=A0A8C9Q8N5_SPEDA
MHNQDSYFRDHLTTGSQVEDVHILQPSSVPEKLHGLQPPWTPEELLRQSQQALNCATREVNQERQKPETQEKKIIADIKKMAKPLKLPQIQKIMMESERQAEIMDMKEEMMNDGESDAVVSQVLEALGLSLMDAPSDLPSTGGSLSVGAGGKKAEATASALADADADLEERLKNLRRG